MACLWLGLLVLLLVSGLARAQSTPDPAAPIAIQLELTGAIGPAATEYVERGLAQAAEADAPFVILRIDTPGGLVSSMRDINRAILGAPMPVIGYVAPGGAQAASAGAFILYATHLAAMAPGTNVGAATPVSMGGAPEEPAPKPGEGEEPARTPPVSDASHDKAVNDAVAYLRSLADLHGRNADWAESAVRDAASLPSAEALSQGVVEIVATDTASLLKQADGRTVRLGEREVTLQTAGVTVEVHAPDWRTRLLAAVTNPNLAYILLLIGIYGIIFEVMSPGAIFPGVLGGVALLTALFALNMLPITFAGAGLLLLGVALMVAEAFTATFGLLGVAGLAVFAVGSVLLFDGDIAGFTLATPVIVLASLASLVLLAVVLAAVMRAHRRRVVTGDEALLQDTGEVLRWSGLHGQVHAQGETWQARAAGPLAVGQRVRITARDGLTIVVEPLNPPT
ncbi:nodulation protein NfeD [Achromobacter sp. GG226]|nr:nodulation protein NfeD [Verticiella sp. GG226]